MVKEMTLPTYLAFNILLYLIYLKLFDNLLQTWLIHQPSYRLHPSFSISFLMFPLALVFSLYHRTTYSVHLCMYLCIYIQHPSIDVNNRLFLNLCSETINFKWKWNYRYFNTQPYLQKPQLICHSVPCSSFSLSAEHQSARPISLSPPISASFLRSYL